MFGFILPVTLLVIKIRNEKKKKKTVSDLTKISLRLSFEDRHQQEPRKS